MTDDDPAAEPFADLEVEGALRAAFQQHGRAHSASPPGGARESDYEMDAEIARGGMGVIVKAFDRELTRDVALKLLRVELVGEPRLVRRFLQEARLTARLDHPGIVPVHQVGFGAEGRPYFAMRLVRGRDLGVILELVRAGREGWSQARALSVILKVCEAMAYAHDKGVIHRDLKPSNVMVGEFGEVYVMDWGLARALDAEDAHDLRLRDRDGSGRDASAADGAAVVTLDGTVLGTPCYMAPEQAMGKSRELGPRSDVYSVGAMLYHLLAGEMPFVPAGSSASSRAVLEQLVDGPPRRLHDVRRDLPAELVAICERAMARDPAQRYPDMLRMAEDLRAFLEQRVVRAYETGAWAEARKWLRRNTALAGALLAVVLALVAGLVVSLSLKARSDDNAAQASAARDDAEAFASVLEETLKGVTPSVALGRDTAMLREMMEGALARVEQGQLSAAPAVELRLLLVIGNAFRLLGEYPRSEAVLGSAVARAERHFAGDQELVARSHFELANLLTESGNPARAESHAQSALDMRRRLYPGDDVRVADSIETLGTVRKGVGDPAGAEVLMREALEMRRRVARGDDHALALNMNNLAVVLADRGDNAGAEMLHRETYAMLERLGRAEDPIAAGTLDSIGVMLYRRGELAASEEHHRRALELRRRLYPGEHPDTAASLVNLASVLQARGDRAAAEAHFREGIAMQRRLYAGDHEVLALTISNLAATLHAAGDLAGAEPLYAEALAMQQRMFPGDHPGTPMQMQNLAQLLRARGELARGEALVRDALAMLRRLAAGDHPDTALVLQTLAGIEQQRGDLPAAEEHCREALAMRQRLFPGDHPDVARSLLGLGYVLEQRGDHASAEAPLRESLRMYRALPGFEGRAAQSALSLGRTLARLARFADADAALVEAERLLRESGSPPAAYAVCLQDLIDNCTRWEAAEPGQGHAADAARWKAELAAAAQPR